MNLILNDAISALSVILVFITVAMDVWSRDSEVVIKKAKPADKEKVYKDQLIKELSKAYSVGIVLMIFLGLLLLLLGPLMCKIVANFSEWVAKWLKYFDVVPFLFSIIYLFLILFFAYITSKSRKLRHRRREVLSCD